MDTMVYSIDELTRILSPVFAEHKVKRAVLFGSYGKGHPSANSDVDLFVDSGLKGLEFVGLIEDIRDSLQGKEADVFDVRHVDPGSLIEKEIQRTGIEIYAQ